jgi:deoxyribodipyrimidine photo-lyase
LLPPSQSVLPFPALQDNSIMKEKIAIHWFRRDLRLNDNAALDAALACSVPVLPVFIFDSEILNKLPSRRDARVLFIHQELESIKKELEKRGASLLVMHGTPLQVFKELTRQFEVAAVYTNRDYEPYALGRDTQVENFLKGSGISFNTYKDHVIFEKDEVLKNDGTPYTVFTPYSRKWKEVLGDRIPESYPSEKKLDNLFRTDPLPFPSLESMGFEDFSFDFPDKIVGNELLVKYGEQRDLPAVKGTSRLGVHLRFGTVSIRELTRQAMATSEVFLNELIWRNFFIQIMAHFPFVVNQPFKKQYAGIPWRNNEQEFEKWCRGETGFPIVDAGMRELNATGFMHNRVRMVTASFLTKHLLIDWRWGEAYFAEKLLDFELASNNGNWQWAAGTGCDAAPYFRVFSPENQQLKFDPKGTYIHKWVPEAGTLSYARPIVDHKMARERAIQTYKKGLME